MINELDHKFKESNLPTSYSISAVQEILMTNYKAVEMEDKTFFDSLKKDHCVNFDQIVKFFVINDVDFLSTLYTEYEKETHIEMSHVNSTYVHPEGSSRTKSEEIWKEIQEGKRIHIVLESADQKTISAFTMQGLCEKILWELIILKGIRPEDCALGNDYYEHYLNVLHSLGKI
ncbi:hypothetical protein [Paenibacillus alvei]|uniref:Uncharacterized protein n=1 Tax=Paenibacillus alvei TaxID=44250 RepID=A0AAP6ZTB7_PAEAL|nr:hypothetical protein [Paenibacillus alvei]NOJ69840.1 hypothetical protein [Paenibacillus alvei]